MAPGSPLVFYGTGFSGDIQPVLPIVVTQDGVPAQSGLSVATI